MASQRPENPDGKSRARATDVARARSLVSVDAGDGGRAPRTCPEDHSMSRPVVAKCLAAPEIPRLVVASCFPALEIPRPVVASCFPAPEIPRLVVASCFPAPEIPRPVVASESPVKSIDAGARKSSGGGLGDGRAVSREPRRGGDSWLGSLRGGRARMRSSAEHERGSRARMRSSAGHDRGDPPLGLGWHGTNKQRLVSVGAHLRTAPSSQPSSRAA